MAKGGVKRVVGVNWADISDGFPQAEAQAIKAQAPGTWSAGWNSPEQPAADAPDGIYNVSDHHGL